RILGRMQKPLWHFDAEYMTASFIINCFLFLVLVFNQASIYDVDVQEAGQVVLCYVSPQHLNLLWNI
ncbi:MAG TPA: hypothetical protein LFV91_06710, partial [Rickettsia endosymbiont of Bembidion nr. Transversale]|nr:hypothetical protein [Rickettsia endosymbiont of Bembidion nr. Transversale]